MLESPGPMVELRRLLISRLSRAFRVTSSGLRDVLGLRFLK